MALPNEIHPFAIAGGGNQYQVANSLRFRASNSASLTRTPGSAGNRQKFTFSTWLKRGTLSLNQGIFSASSGADQNNEFLLFFGSGNGDTISVQQTVGGTSAGQISTISNAVFRDPSAWYHIVLAIDTTQATSTNRLFLYVNGVSQTFSTYSVGSSINTWVNNTNGHSISKRADASLYFDGYQTEIYLIDGQQLDPTYFGQTDSITGIWSPKKYTGTYGTNGFYLPFNDATSTTTLGYDRQLGMSDSSKNNWTASGITTAASGNTVTSFTSVGTTSWTAPAGVTSVRYLVVAGGGGGGSLGGGGGGGGVLDGTLAVVPGTSYTVTVGDGGAGGIGGNLTTGGYAGSNGSNSVFHSITAIGGGGGGGWNGNSTTNGFAGGSGGGGGSGGSVGTGTGGAGTPGQGYSGGNAGNFQVSPYYSGGGGGAGGPGGSSNGANAGGPGLSSNITGSSVTYGGGGGGTGWGSAGGAAGPGGSGGGGNGAASTTGGSGTTNTGGGGGGTGYAGASVLPTGGAGGSGIVILSYATVTTNTIDSCIDSPTAYNDGGNNRGNYPTLNPLSYFSTAGTLTNGNMSVSYGNSSNHRPTLGARSGKWYAEITCTSAGGYSGTGLSISVNTTDTTSSTPKISSFYYNNGQTYNYGSSSFVSYGASWTTNDIIGVAFDCDTGDVTFYKNGVSQGTLTSSSNSFNVNGYDVAPFPSAYNSGVTTSFIVNYGQRPFIYVPPAGFKALNTYNLANPSLPLV